MAPRVLVIVPAYNEESSLPAVVADLRKHVPTCDVVVIDDCSTDATAARARELGVDVLRLPINLGIGGAVQTGFRYAHRCGYDVAIQVDGDGQHPAEGIAGLLAPLQSGQADVVIGSRFLEREGFQSTVARRMGIRAFEWLTRLTSGVRVTDTTSGFRAYNRGAIVFLAEHYPSDYPEVESVTILTRNGFRIVEVPATMRERQGGTSSITAARSLYYLIKVSLASLVSMVRPRRRAR
jgi:glycosyltransferase involved in cell wall biosynthesis